MASNSLRGLGGQRHTPYNLRTNELSKATCKVSNLLRLLVWPYKGDKWKYRQKGGFQIYV